jgi:hypothetical protein
MRHATMCIAMVPANQNQRCEIDRLGVGGAVPFARARANAGLPPANRCPTGIARGVEFLGFRQHRSATASKGSFVGAFDAVENQIVETMDAPKVEAALGEHAAVLGDSLDGMTARQIAEKRGWGDDKSAEQRAVRAQDRALAALAEVQKRAA